MARSARPLPIVVGALVGALLFAGCQSEIEHGLDEHEANDIIVVLEKSGIASDKLKEEGGQVPAFTITVPKGEKARAMELLVANHLPPPRKDGIKELFPSDVMIPTQTNEAMRKLAAQQNELAKSLAAIDGVLSASVNLNIPERSELEEKTKPLPSASVIITYRVAKGADAKPPVTAPQIQSFVGKAVQDLTPDNVSVILNPATLPGGADTGEQFVDVLGLRMSADSVGSFKIMAAVMILSMIGLALWIGLLYMQKSSGPPSRSGRSRPPPAEA
jgi:type III secretion protein J